MTTSDQFGYGSYQRKKASRVSVLMRRVSSTINDCSLEFVERGFIDFRIATEQHLNYKKALEGIGASVHLLSPLDEYPDACFVEDAAIVVKGIALICRMGTESRRGEEQTVKDFLQREYDLVIMEDPATAEGGDVLVAEDRVFVGISSRTNQKGFKCIHDALRPLGFDVVKIEVRGALHLKTVCSYVGNGNLLAATQFLGQGKEALEKDYRIIQPSLDEVAGANVVVIDQYVFVPSSCPKIMKRLSREGLKPVPVDISEIQKAEAGLSCLGIVCRNG